MQQLQLSEGMLKAGWLSKQKLGRVWAGVVPRKRYFVLGRHHLAYCDTDAPTAQPLGMIHLSTVLGIVDHASSLAGQNATGADRGVRPEEVHLLTRISSLHPAHPPAPARHPPPR